MNKGKKDMPGRRAEDSLTRNGIPSEQDYLHPPMETWTIRDLCQADIPTILVLGENALGANYIQESTLTDEQNMVVCAEVQGTTVGFCTGKILASQSLSASFGRGSVCPIPALEDFAEIGWVGSIAVCRKYQRRGIGHALMEVCLQRLHDRGAELVMMTAWKTKDGIPIGSIAEAKGFRKQCEIKEFWTEDNLNKQYSCTMCHPPPCHCPAIIYTLRFCG
jgi:GNAT superfamily N-acetyltransferase